MRRRYVGSMIHTMLPEQFLQKAGSRAAEPRKRLMLAVLMTAVDDCQGSVGRQTDASGIDRRSIHEALRYITSTDRSWPFSFENLCEAVGVDAGSLRRGLQRAALARLVIGSAGLSTEH